MMQTLALRPALTYLAPTCAGGIDPDEIIQTRPARVHDITAMATRAEQRLNPPRLGCGSPRHYGLMLLFRLQRDNLAVFTRSGGKNSVEIYGITATAPIADGPDGLLRAWITAANEWCVLAAQSKGGRA
jgi:hypothetical protein